MDGRFIYIYICVIYLKLFVMNTPVLFLGALLMVLVLFVLPKLLLRRKSKCDSPVPRKPKAQS
jgi:hypothetical protein